MAVALATLNTDLWDTMYNHLQTGTYALSTDNIFGAYNDQLIADKGFPCVIIKPPEVNIMEKDFGGQIVKADVSYVISIYHKSSASMKVQTDEVINKIRTGSSVFSAVGLKKVREGFITDVAYTTWQTTPNHRVHMQTIAINFRYTNG